MPSIIAQELIEIWRQLLRGVPQDIWLSIKTTDDFGCNLQTATNLAEEEYDSLLISSGITFKKGNITMIRKAKLDYLQTALKENIILHITLSKLERNGNKMFFIASGCPTFCNPSAQAKADVRVLPNHRGNGLDEERLRLLESLCTERATADEPELIVEEQLPLPPQILEQEQPEYELPQEEELQPSPERRTRTRGGRQE